jgi:hypothetical protein
MPQIPSDFQEYIDSVPWEELDDGYGNSAEIGTFGTLSLPTLLTNLCSDNEDERLDAINDGLWGRASHQGSVYSATAFAAKALLILLKTRAVTDLSSGGMGSHPVSYDILRFLCHCWKFVQNTANAKPYFPLFLNAARENIDTIISYQSDSDPEVCNAAQLLSSYIAAAPIKEKIRRSTKFPE